MLFKVKGLVTEVRKPEIQDANILMKWLASKDFHDYLGGKIGMPHSYYETMIERMLNENADDHALRKHYIIVDSFTKNPVGLWTLAKIDWKNRNLESSYIIGEIEYKGSLIAGDVNIIMLNYIFQELNMHKIYSYAYDHNIKIQRMNNFGSSHDAILKSQKWIDGIAYDVHVHSLTKSAFKEFVVKHSKGVLRKHIQAGLLRNS